MLMLVKGGMEKYVPSQKRRGFDDLTRDWAIGSHGWKQALARAHRHRAVELDMPRNEIHSLKEQPWTTMLDAELRSRGEDSAAAALDPIGRSLEGRNRLRFAQEVRCTLSVDRPIARHGFSNCRASRSLSSR